MSPWIDGLGMFVIVTVLPGLRAAYAPRYDADEASPSIKRVLGALYFWLARTRRVLKFLEVSTLTPNFFINLMVISMYGFEASSPVMRMVMPFSVSGAIMSRLEMYWLLMLPGRVTVPPLSLLALMWSGGQPDGEVVIFAPSLLSASVSGLIGRSFIRLLPVIVTSLFRVAAREVRNLVVVPALPRLILPGVLRVSCLRPFFI